MIDLSRLSETFQSLLGSGTAQDGLGGIAEQLTNLNLDPADLAQLSAPELLTTLSENGIDLAQMDPEQITALMEQFGGADALPQLTELLSEHLR